MFSLLRPKLTVLFLQSALIIVIMLLFACSDPTIQEGDSGPVAIFDVTVDGNTIDNESRCFFNDGNLDASAFVYCGTPAQPVDCDGRSGPRQKQKLLKNDDLDYEATVSINSSGPYSIAIVCGVGSNQNNQPDSLKYINYNSYVVSIKDSSNIIQEGNKPAGHLPHRGSSHTGIGLVCNDCHRVGPNNDFLYTTIDHVVLIGECVDCHSDAGIADAPSVDHIVFGTSMQCTDCHVDYMWFREPPTDHDSSPDGCEASTCHQYQLPSVGHDGITSGCEVCHIQTDWKQINP